MAAFVMDYRESQVAGAHGIRRRAASRSSKRSERDEDGASESSFGSCSVLDDTSALQESPQVRQTIPPAPPAIMHPC